MNILLINHYAGGPEFGMEFRPHGFAKRWNIAGNNTTIFGSTFSHLRKIQPTAHSQNIDGVDYRWLFGNSYQGNGLGRILNIFLFIIQLLILSPYIALVKKPDVVISSSTYTFDIIPCWIIAKISRAKLVFEIHDLWPMSLYEIGNMSKYHPFAMAVTLCEYLSYKLSDKVISILPNAFEHAKNFSIKSENFLHIPNGHDFSLTTENCSKEIKSIILASRKKGNFNIAYCGSIGEANNIDNFIKLAINLRKQKIVFNVVGSGPKQQHLKNAIEKHSLKVNYFGHINKKSIPDFLKENDACFVYYNNLKLCKFGIGSNKVFDYMNAKKPVILCCKTSNDPVSLSQCGFVIADSSIETAASGILKAAKTEPTTLKNMGVIGYKYLHKIHNYDKLAKQFLDFLND